MRDFNKQYYLVSFLSSSLVRVECPPMTAQSTARRSLNNVCPLASALFIFRAFRALLRAGCSQRVFYFAVWPAAFLFETTLYKIYIVRLTLGPLSICRVTLVAWPAQR